MYKVIPMPVSLFWYDDTHREIIIRFRDQWTWAQFYAADIGSRKLMYDVPHPVSVVMDTRGAMLPPPELPAHLLAITRHSHPNLRHLIILRDTDYAKWLVELLQRYRHKDTHRVFHATTLEDALQVSRS